MEYEIDADESVDVAIVRAVGAVEGRDPCSLQPLSYVLDPDALDMLFDSRANGAPRTGGCLSFIYSSCRITVDNGKYLTIELLRDYRRARSRSKPTTDPVANED